jgi:hypothetical protein
MFFQIYCLDLNDDNTEIKSIRTRCTFPNGKRPQILFGARKGQGSLRHFSGILSDKNPSLQRFGSVDLNHQITTRVHKAFRLQESGRNSSLAVTTHMW